MQEVVERRPLREEFRVRDVTDMRKPAAVEPEAHLLPGADRHRALHDEDRARAQIGELVEHSQDRREVGLPGVRRRRRHADEGDPGVREHVARVEREPDALPVLVQKLRKPALIDRDAARLEIGDALRHDVLHHDFVAELGEAGGRDEADPAGSDDSERLRHPSHSSSERYLVFSGRSPFAIASIVSFDRRSRSVLTTQ
jgi:hypothetical protein